MKWHKIVFNHEQISAGELSKFQDACMELYRAFNCPKGMVLLIDSIPGVSSTKPGFETSVYFSPGSLPYAQPIISHYSGEPCVQPDMKDVAFFIGDLGAIKSHQ
jgi:hypothetical protein